MRTQTTQTREGGHGPSSSSQGVFGLDVEVGVRNRIRSPSKIGTNSQQEEKRAGIEFVCLAVGVR